MGDEALEQIISADEGSARLGEVALVPVSSPINRSGVLFYNTLYDENAACHLALGFGFDNAVKGSESMDYDQITAAGVNRSMMHVEAHPAQRSQVRAKTAKPLSLKTASGPSDKPYAAECAYIKA